MRLCVLVSALEQDTDALPARMGLESDAVIVNQTDHDARETVLWRGRQLKLLSRKERGVGRSRNLALDEAWGDLVLFADEDIVYDSGYAARIVQAFRRRPHTDILLFNLRVNEERRTYWNEKEKAVHRFNCGRYPTFCAAARLSSLRRAGVRFSLLFGGGAPYSNGEDSLFFTDCLRKGLKIRALPVTIGREEPRESTWFHGYDKKFFYDRGVLYAFLYGRMAELWALRFVVTKKKIMCGEIPPARAFALMKKGIAKGRRLCRG